MNKENILKLIIVAFLLGITFFFEWKYESLIMFPITTIILCGILIFEFFYSKKQIRNGTYFEFGNKSLLSSKSLSWIILGVGIMVFEYFSNSNKLVDLVCDRSFLVGVFFIVVGLTYRNYLILFKKKRLWYYDVLFSRSSLKYNKVEKLVIRNNSLELIYKTGKEYYEFKPNSVKIERLINFLQPKLGDKIVLNKNLE